METRQFLLLVDFTYLLHQWVMMEQNEYRTELKTTCSDELYQLNHKIVSRILSLKGLNDESIISLR